MNARLHAVQRVMWTLVVASIAVALLSFPRGNNRAYTAALDELTGFAQSFKQADLEKSLLDYARTQGTVQPVEVQRLITGPQVPKVQLSAAAKPIPPLAEIHLRTLGEVAEHAKPNGTLDIGALTPAPLAAAVAWRLARVTPAPPHYELTAVTLEPAVFTPADIELEAAIGKSRVETAAAEKAAADAEKKLTSAEDTFEARRKRKLPWKILLKFDEVRKTARVTLDERKKALDEIRARYEGEVKRAEATAAKPAAASGPLPTQYALAQVTLNGAPGQVTTLRVPVALNVQPAKLPGLAGSSFAATHEAGLWDAAKDQNAEQAIALTRSKFTWHYRYAELAGMRIGGMTLLQVLPCILPLLLLALLSRIRRVSGTYNPFGTTLDKKLPRVGLGSRPLELAVLVLLPLAAVVLTAFALWAVSQVPVLPLIAAFAAIGLGGYAFVELGSLQELLEAVVRSHSNPPAKPESTALGGP
ncbi:MAG TPA: hypothetical protein VFG30_23805 [Polyangiales bacterium]|nr:hypothetical protein [Polyangiales bacterium]